MDSFSLSTTAVDSCQGSLRGRRRSSVHMFGALSKIARDDSSFSRSALVDGPNEIRVSNSPAFSGNAVAHGPNEIRVSSSALFDGPNDIRVSSSALFDGPNDIRVSSSPLFDGPNDIRVSSSALFDGPNDIRVSSSALFDGPNDIRVSSSALFDGPNDIRVSSSPLFDGPNDIRVSSSPLFDGPNKIRVSSSALFDRPNEIRVSSSALFDGPNEIRVSSSLLFDGPDNIRVSNSSVYPRIAHFDGPNEIRVSNSEQLSSPTPPPLESPTLSPLSHVHVSSNATVTTVSRYDASLSNITPSDPLSPYSTAPPTAADSRAPSPDPETPERASFAFDSLKWRLASGYFAIFVYGWGDGVTGTVMPYLSAEFNLTTMTSSLLWVGTTCGFFIGTFVVESILKWMGRFNLDSPGKNALYDSTGKRKRTYGYSLSKARHLALVVASVLHGLYFILMASRSGFPLMFVAYVVAAFARALLSTPLNAYLAAGPKQALPYAYGLASVGSVASPLVCQSIIATGVPWFHFYYGSLVLSGINLMFLALTFKPSSIELAKERRGYMNVIRTIHGSKAADAGDGLRSGMTSPTVMSPRSSVTNLQTSEGKGKDNNKSTLKIAVRIPYQWAFSMFALLYCGSETVTQGFMVTYLLRTKYANPKTVGYVTSGFWAGMSIGRFAWGTFLASSKGSTLCIAAFLGLSLQLILWLVKPWIFDSVAGSFVGFFYGPVFPALLAMANDVLPEEVHMVAMALINAFASLGGAIFPFVAGALISMIGNSAYPIVTISLAGSLFLFWAFFHSSARKKTIAID